MASASSGHAHASAPSPVLSRAPPRSAPMALRMGKVAVNLGLNMDMASGLRVEEACYAQLIPTQDRCAWPGAPHPLVLWGPDLSAPPVLKEPPHPAPSHAHNPML